MSADVLFFWFEELTPKQWYVKDPELDQLIKDRFYSLHEKAVQGELWAWRETAKGRLAEVIILDQFSRNMFRDTPQAFTYDPIALVLSQEAISLGLDETLSLQEKQFLYMPFMHSESAVIHAEAVKLFSLPGLEYNLEFERKHKEIIEQFARYPHRNQILGRKPSKEESQFLEQGGATF